MTALRLAATPTLAEIAAHPELVVDHHQKMRNSRPAPP
jgi:hypothetical protein